MWIDFIWLVCVLCNVDTARLSFFASCTTSSFNVTPSYLWFGNGSVAAGNDGLTFECNFDISNKPDWNLQLILLHEANKIGFDVYLHIVFNSLEFFLRMDWSTSGGPIPKGMPDQWGLATAFFFVFTAFVATAVVSFGCCSMSSSQHSLTKSENFIFIRGRKLSCCELLQFLHM